MNHVKMDRRSFMLATALVALKRDYGVSAEAVTLEPEDVVVLKYTGGMTPEKQEEVRAKATEAFHGRRIIFMQDLDFQVLSDL